MGPPRPRVGTLAGGRGVGAGRGAGGARGVGRHGWRMASLLSTLPLPLVTAPPPSARYPHLRVTVLGAASQDCLRLVPPALPPSARISAPGPAGTPVAGVSPVGAARARRALRGASGPRRRRAPAAPASPWIALSRLPPSRAPSPVTRPPHGRACAVRLPSGECATRAPALSPPSPGFASPSFSPIP